MNLKLWIAVPFILNIAAASAQAASLLTNGGFESGLTGWTTSGNGGTYNQNVDFGVNFGVSEGQQAFAFNGGNQPPNAILSQTFGTVANAEYQLSFDYGAWGDHVPQVLQVYVDDQLLTTIQDDTVTRLGGGAAFSAYAYAFVAGGETTKLEFRDGSNSNSFNTDGLLDNVFVSGLAPHAVPLPAALWGGVLLLSLLGLTRLDRTLRTQHV